MTTTERKLQKAEIVLRMERRMRNINHEGVFMTWLSLGVADGDINEDTTPEEVIEMGYTDADTFYDLVDVYTKLVDRAAKNGGFID